MNAVIKDENSKEGAFGWLQFEEGSSGTAAACASCPHGHGRAAIPGQQHGALKCPCGQPRGHVQKLGISVRAVAGAVATLSNHNFIEVVKVGNMNVYRINSRVAWQGKRGKGSPPSMQKS